MLRSRLNRPIVAIIAVTALAGFLRFVHLQHPPEFVFDEVYYPKAACILVGWSNDVCHIDSGDEKYWRTNKWDVGSWVHPPLGKWQIAMGIKAFGMNPFGWRVTSALAGTLVVTLTAVLAQLLFGSALWTFVAGSIIAVEDLNIVMSRTALLDVHLEFWVMIGFIALVMDRRWLERRQPPDPEPDLLEEPPSVAPVFSPLWRPWRFAAGAAFGAAAAVKWSGAMAIVRGDRDQLHLGGLAAAPRRPDVGRRDLAGVRAGVARHRPGVRAPAVRRLHDHVDALVPPFRLELDGVVARTSPRR